jgi:hypothetical protein
MGQGTSGGASATQSTDTNTGWPACPFFFSEHYTNPADKHAMKGMAVFPNVSGTEQTVRLMCDINDAEKGTVFSTAITAYAIRSQDNRVTLPASFRYRRGNFPTGFPEPDETIGSFDNDNATAEPFNTNATNNVTDANLNFTTHWTNEWVKFCAATTLGTPGAINPGEVARVGQLRMVYCAGTSPCDDTGTGVTVLPQTVSANMPGEEEYHSAVICTLVQVPSAGTYHLEMEKATMDGVDGLPVAAYGQAVLGAIPLRLQDGTSFDVMGQDITLTGTGTTSGSLSAFYTQIFASNVYADPFRYLLWSTYTARPTTVGSGTRNWISELWAPSTAGPLEPVVSLTDFHNSGGPTDYLPGFLISHTAELTQPSAGLVQIQAQFATGDDPPNTDIGPGLLAGFRLVPDQTSIPSVTQTGTVTYTGTPTLTPVASNTPTPTVTTTPAATSTGTSTPITPKPCVDVTGPTPGVPDGICRVAFVGETDTADIRPWLTNTDPEGDYTYLGPQLCGCNATDFYSAQMADFLDASPGDCTGCDLWRGDNGPVDVWFLEAPYADLGATRYAPKVGVCYGGDDDGDPCRVNIPEGTFATGTNMLCVEGSEFGQVCSPGSNDCTGDPEALDPVESYCKANVWSVTDGVHVSGCRAPGLCHQRAPLASLEFNYLRMLNRVFDLQARPVMVKPLPPPVWGADADRCAEQGCPYQLLPIGLGDVPIPTIAAPREHQYRAIAAFNQWLDALTGKYQHGDPADFNGADIGFLDWQKLAQHEPVEFPLVDKPRAHGQTWEAFGDSSFTSDRGDGHCTCLIDADCGNTPTPTITPTPTRTFTSTPTNTP